MAHDNYNASGAEWVASLGMESFTGPALEVGRVGWVGDHPKYTMNPHRARVSGAFHRKVGGYHLPCSLTGNIPHEGPQQAGVPWWPRSCPT